MVGSRLGRASSRYGPSATAAMFNGLVRKWKKKWIHVSPSTTVLPLPVQQPHRQHLLSPPLSVDTSVPGYRRGRCFVRGASQMQVPLHSRMCSFSLFLYKLLFFSCLWFNFEVGMLDICKWVTFFISSCL